MKSYFLDGNTFSGINSKFIKEILIKIILKSKFLKN